MSFAGETKPCLRKAWRRRSNRPGNSQAKGPRKELGALESVLLPNGGSATEGEANAAFGPDLLKLSGIPTEGAGTLR